MDGLTVLDHHCLECHYQGPVETAERKATCPTCGTVNDVWLEGEEPPVNHREGTA